MARRHRLANRTPSSGVSAGSPHPDLRRFPHVSREACMTLDQVIAHWTRVREEMRQAYGDSHAMYMADQNRFFYYQGIGSVLESLRTVDAEKNRDENA